MSPSAAAAEVGVSRRTIERAIKSGRLRARQGNDRTWRIEPEALEQWAGAHAPRMRQDDGERTPGAHAHGLRIAQDRAAHLERERDQERERRQELQTERDRERRGRDAAEARACEVETAAREREARLECTVDRERARADRAEAEVARLRELPPQRSWLPWWRRASGAASGA